MECSEVEQLALQCSACSLLLSWAVALRSLWVRRGATAAHHMTLLLWQSRQKGKASLTSSWVTRCCDDRWLLFWCYRTNWAEGNGVKLTITRLNRPRSCLWSWRSGKDLGLLRRRGQSWRMERDEVSFWRSVFSLFSLFLSPLRVSERRTALRE